MPLFAGYQIKIQKFQSKVFKEYDIVSHNLSLLFLSKKIFAWIADGMQNQKSGINLS